jgi:hypothetical protein
MMNDRFERVEIDGLVDRFIAAQFDRLFMTEPTRDAVKAVFLLMSEIGILTRRDFLKGARKIPERSRSESLNSAVRRYLRYLTFVENGTEKFMVKCRSPESMRE